MLYHMTWYYVIPYFFIFYYIVSPCSMICYAMLYTKIPHNISIVYYFMFLY